MKKFVIGFMAVVFSVPALATIIYVKDGDYFGTKIISGSDSLIMTGGGGITLEGGDNSILDIRNTSSPVVNGVSGIVDIHLGDSSKLYFSGGCAAQLSIGGDAIAILTGGQINQISGYYFFPADTSRITVYCQSGWTHQNGYLSGQWLDGSAFNIKLVTKSGSDIFSNMTIIPEPATMLLLAVGGLLLKRK